MSSSKFDRREMLRMMGAAGLAVGLGPAIGISDPAPITTRKIPKSGEELPVIGLGSWGTFNVGDDPAAQDSSSQVI